MGWLEKIDFFYAWKGAKSKTGNSPEGGLVNYVGLAICSSLGWTSLMLLMNYEKKMFCGDLGSFAELISPEMLKWWLIGLWDSK